MDHTALRRAFVVFRITLGAVVLYGSIPPAVTALVTRSWHVALLAAVEAVGAALFLWPRTLRVGGSLMLGTFVIAIVAHALRGELAANLLVYASGALFVVLHGGARPRPGEAPPPAV